MKMIGLPYAHALVIALMKGTVSEISLLSGTSLSFENLLDKKRRVSRLEAFCDVLEGLIREKTLSENERTEIYETLEKLALEYPPMSNNISTLLSLL